MNFNIFTFLITISTIILPSSISFALPPPDDIPEEILVTEIITEGRSPLDNQSLTASEYEELQAQLAKSKYPLELSPKVRHIIFLLQLLKLGKTINPFD